MDGAGTAPRLSHCSCRSVPVSGRTREVGHGQTRTHHRGERRALSTPTPHRPHFPREIDDHPPYFIATVGPLEICPSSCDVPLSPPLRPCCPPPWHPDPLLALAPPVTVSPPCVSLSCLTTPSLPRNCVPLFPVIAFVSFSYLRHRPRLASLPPLSSSASLHCRLLSSSVLSLPPFVLICTFSTRFFSFFSQFCSRAALSPSRLLS